MPKDVRDRNVGGAAIAIENSVSFGTALRQYREEAGLSQEELAERAGLTSQAIGAIERGERKHPYPATVRRLADALGLPDEMRAALLAAVPHRRHVRESPVPQESTTAEAVPAVAPYLPLPLTPLLGREGDVAVVTDLLQSGVRLLTVTGPGGVGKTRLALHLAAACAHLFPDGVTFVPLAPLTDGRLVASAAARALGVPDSSAITDGERLVHALRGRRLLLLDNCEHVLRGAAALAALLESCPDLVILATSRAPLRVRGEQEYPLTSLTVPSDGQRVSVFDAGQFGAVRLFVERARAARPGFCLTSENVEAVVEICRRLDGLPLAIELAAPRVKLLPPQALLQRLSRRLALLTGGAADLPARQQTLRSAIDWGYSLLSPQQQALFVHLSVFAGGCTLDDVEAVCGAEEDLLDGLASLVDLSLLRQEGTNEPRFAMLETVREFAAEKLAESGEAEAIGRAHAAHFLQVALDAERGLYGPAAGVWAERVEGALDNIRTALRWFLDRGAVDDELRLASALEPFWRAYGHWHEGQHWLDEGLGAGAREITPIRARALLVLGSLLTYQGQCSRAAPVLESALTYLRDLGDMGGSALALTYLSLCAFWRGEYDNAGVYLQESEPLWTRLDDPGQYAGLLGMQGATAMEQGRFAAARERLEEAVSLARAVGGPDRLALEVTLLGHLAYHEGNLPEATVCFAEAVALAEPLRARRTLSYALLGQGLVACAQGRLDRARASFTESLHLARELGYQYGVLLDLTGLAAVALEAGDAERSARLKGAEAALRATLGIPLPPTFTSQEEDMLDRLRTTLGPEAFARAWARGESMSLDEAVSDALGERVQQESLSGPADGLRRIRE